MVRYTKDPDEQEYPHPTTINPTASFGLIYRDSVPMVDGGGRCVWIHVLSLRSSHLPCHRAPRDCRLILRICVGCWVSDDLDAWPACALRTVVASVNVIVVVVLDRRPFVAFCSSVPHTTPHYRNPVCDRDSTARHQSLHPHQHLKTQRPPASLPLPLTGHADIASTVTPYISHLLPSHTLEERQELAV